MLTTQYSFLNEAHRLSYWSMLMTSSLLEMMKQCLTLFRMLSAHNSKPPTLVRPPGSSEYAYDTILQPEPCSSTKPNTSRVSYHDMVWRTAPSPPPSLCIPSFNPCPLRNMHLFPHIPILR